MQKVYYCGICDHYHRADWDGDCRDDAERFTLAEIITHFGVEGFDWIEVDMPV